MNAPVTWFIKLDDKFTIVDPSKLPEDEQAEAVGLGCNSVTIPTGFGWTTACLLIAAVDLDGIDLFMTHKVDLVCSNGTTTEFQTINKLLIKDARCVVPGFPHTRRIAHDPSSTIDESPLSLYCLELVDIRYMWSKLSPQKQSCREYNRPHPRGGFREFSVRKDTSVPGSPKFKPYTYQEIITDLWKLLPNFGLESPPAPEIKAEWTPAYLDSTKDHYHPSYQFRAMTPWQMLQVVFDDLNVLLVWNPADGKFSCVLRGESNGDNGKYLSALMRECRTTDYDAYTSNDHFVFPFTVQVEIPGFNNPAGSATVYSDGWADEPTVAYPVRTSEMLTKVEKDPLFQAVAKPLIANTTHLLRIPHFTTWGRVEETGEPAFDDEGYKKLAEFYAERYLKVLRFRASPCFHAFAALIPLNPNLWTLGSEIDAIAYRMFDEGLISEWSRGRILPGYHPSQKLGPAYPALREEIRRPAVDGYDARPIQLTIVQLKEDLDDDFGANASQFFPRYKLEVKDPLKPTIKELAVTGSSFQSYNPDRSTIDKPDQNFFKVYRPDKSAVYKSGSTVIIWLDVVTQLWIVVGGVPSMDEYIIMLKAETDIGYNSDGKASGAGFDNGDKDDPDRKNVRATTGELNWTIASGSHFLAYKLRDHYVTSNDKSPPLYQALQAQYYPKELVDRLNCDPATQMPTYHLVKVPLNAKITDNT